LHSRPSRFASSLHCHPKASLPSGVTLGRRTSPKRRQSQIEIVISTKFYHYNAIFVGLELIYDPSEAMRS